jgi:hypothetical protein
MNQSHRPDHASAPEWATPHHLRHFFASLLIARGASVKQVQARLGDASAKTTLDIYGHLCPTTRTPPGGWSMASLRPWRKRLVSPVCHKPASEH